VGADEEGENGDEEDEDDAVEISATLADASAGKATAAKGGAKGGGTSSSGTSSGGEAGRTTVEKLTSTFGADGVRCACVVGDRAVWTGQRDGVVVRDLAKGSEARARSILAKKKAYWRKGRVKKRAPSSSSSSSQY
jgi:hypothetical protein